MGPVDIAEHGAVFDKSILLYFVVEFFVTNKKVFSAMLFSLSGFSGGPGHAKLEQIRELVQ